MTQLKIKNHYVFVGHLDWSYGMAWFRVFGYGAYVKWREHAMLFSERNHLHGKWIGRFFMDWIKPDKGAYTADDVNHDLWLVGEENKKKGCKPLNEIIPKANTRIVPFKDEYMLKLRRFTDDK